MNTKALRQKVLDLAIHGKLVPQNPNDESATVLLEKIRAEKAEKIKKGELKADKKDSFIFTKECEFDEDKLGKCSSGTRHKRHYEQFADGTVKDIEGEIPFKVPKGWAWTKIHCVSSEILYGVSESAKETGKYKLLRITDIQDDQVNWDSVPFTDFPEDKVSNYILKNGDIVFARTGATVGKSYLIENLNIESIYASYLIRIRTSLLLNPRYMKYYFGSLTYWNQITDKSSGIGQPNVNGTSLANLYIPIPPYNEQERILPVIEKVFMLIDSLENDKDKLENLIKVAKSKILDLAIHGKLVPQDPNDEPAEELLKRIATSDNRPYEKVEEEPFEIPDSWKWVKLNDLAEIARGGSPRPIQDYITEDKDGINWIKIGDTIEESKYITSAKEKIKPEGKKHSRFVHAGDFLLTNSMSFGRPYILKIDGCIHDGWLVFANIKGCLLQDYLYYALSSAYIYETFSNVAAGSTVKNLKSDTVKQVDFPLPPLSEQKRIVETIENLYEVLDQIQNNLV